MERWEHQALEMSQVGTEAESKEGLLPTLGYHCPGATTAQGLPPPNTLPPQVQHAASETSPTAEIWRLTQISWVRSHCR